METPPCPSCMRQLRTITFSQAAPTRRPSRLRPLLMAMQSSPVSKSQPSISTSVEHSGSQPSLFGPWLEIFTLRTVTLRHSTGFSSHMGELRMVMPSISTLVERYGWKKFGRRAAPSPKTRSLTGTSLVGHGHQFGAPGPAPSWATSGRHRPARPACRCRSRQCWSAPRRRSAASNSCTRCLRSAYRPGADSVWDRC